MSRAGGERRRAASGGGMHAPAGPGGAPAGRRRRARPTRDTPALGRGGIRLRDAPAAVPGAPLGQQEVPGARVLAGGPQQEAAAGEGGQHALLFVQGRPAAGGGLHGLQQAPNQRHRHFTGRGAVRAGRRGA